MVRNVAGNAGPLFGVDAVVTPPKIGGVSRDSDAVTQAGRSL